MQKRLLVIEANTTGSGMLALYKAQEIGLVPLFVTNNPQRYLGLEQTGCQVLVCDTNSLAEILQTIEAQVDIQQVVGVTTTSEFYLETVAHLAEHLTLPGNTLSALKACRDKAQTRLRLAEAGILQPRFVIIRTLSELQAIARLHPPYVVKPVDDTGSYQVRLCQTYEEVLEQTALILSLETNVRGQRTARMALVEEFLDAPELSVEMLTWQGATHCIGLTEKSLMGFPYFVEQRHIFPARLPPDVARDVETTVCRTLEILGITHGATHTEVKLTAQGCAIIEVNARPAGGMIPELIRLVTGFDLLTEQLKIAIGLSPRLPAAYNGYAGIYFLVAPMVGTLKSIQGLDAAGRTPGVAQVTITAAVDRPVALPRSAYDRLGYIIARAETYPVLLHSLEQAGGKIDIVVAPQEHEEPDRREECDL